MREVPPGFEFSSLVPGGEERVRPNLHCVGALLHQHHKMRTRGYLANPCALIVYQGPQTGMGSLWEILDNDEGLLVRHLVDGGRSEVVPYRNDDESLPIGRVVWFCTLVITGKKITDYGTNPVVDVHLPEGWRPNAERRGHR